MKSDDESERALWFREEAFNLEKMLFGVRRLDFQEWKAQRDSKARTVAGGAA